MSQKRPATEIDPDYEDLSDQQNKRQRLLEDDAKEASIQRIQAVIQRQYVQEIQNKEGEIELLDQRLHESQRMLDRLRACIVASYYSKAGPTATQSASNAVPPIHPAVKPHLGKAPRDSKIPTSSETGTLTPPAPSETRLHSSCSSTSKNTQCERPRPTLTRPGKEKRRVIIGSVSMYIPVDKRDELDQSTHKWMMYVRGPRDRPQLDDIVKKTLFFLHPSYQPNDIVEVSTPPFHLTRRGWGEFPVRVQLHFKHPRNKPIDIIHHLKLDRSYTGLQTLGSETLVDVDVDTEAPLSHRSPRNSESKRRRNCSTPKARDQSVHTPRQMFSADDIKKEPGEASDLYSTGGTILEGFCGITSFSQTVTSPSNGTVTSTLTDVDSGRVTPSSGFEDSIHDGSSDRRLVPSFGDFGSSRASSPGKSTNISCSDMQQGWTRIQIKCNDDNDSTVLSTPLQSPSDRGTPLTAKSEDSQSGWMHVQIKSEPSTPDRPGSSCSGWTDIASLSTTPDKPELQPSIPSSPVTPDSSRSSFMRFELGHNISPGLKMNIADASKISQRQKAGRLSRDSLSQDSSNLSDFSSWKHSKTKNASQTQPGSVALLTLGSGPGQLNLNLQSPKSSDPVVTSSLAASISHSVVSVASTALGSASQQLVNAATAAAVKSKVSGGAAVAGGEALSASPVQPMIYVKGVDSTGKVFLIPQQIIGAKQNEACGGVAAKVGASTSTLLPTLKSPPQTPGQVPQTRLVIPVNAGSQPSTPQLLVMKPGNPRVTCAAALTSSPMLVARATMPGQTQPTTQPLLLAVTPGTVKGTTSVGGVVHTQTTVIGGGTSKATLTYILSPGMASIGGTSGVTTSTAISTPIASLAPGSVRPTLQQIITKDGQKLFIIPSIGHQGAAAGKQAILLPSGTAAGQPLRSGQAPSLLFSPGAVGDKLAPRPLLLCGAPGNNIQVVQKAAAPGALQGMLHSAQCSTDSGVAKTATAVTITTKAGDIKVTANKLGDQTCKQRTASKSSELVDKAVEQPQDMIKVGVVASSSMSAFTDTKSQAQGKKITPQNGVTHATTASIGGHHTRMKHATATCSVKPTGAVSLLRPRLSTATVVPDTSMVNSTIRPSFASILAKSTQGTKMLNTISTPTKGNDLAICRPSGPGQSLLRPSLSVLTKPSTSVVSMKTSLTSPEHSNLLMTTKSQTSASVASSSAAGTSLMASSSASSLDNIFQTSSGQLLTTKIGNQTVLLKVENESPSMTSTNGVPKSTALMRNGEKSISRRTARHVTIRPKDLKHTAQEECNICVKDHCSMESLVKSVVRHHPLILDDVDRSLHPYCAYSMDIFMGWVLGKRRSAEWMRASAVRRRVAELLEGEDSFHGSSLWATKRVMMWCRHHCYSPLDAELMRSLRRQPSLSYSLRVVPPSYTRQVALLSRLDQEGHLGSKSALSDDDDVEVTAVESATSVVVKQEDPGGDQAGDILQPTPQQEFVNNTVTQVGIQLKPMELESGTPNICGSAVEDMLFSSMLMFADDIVRTAAALQFAKNRFPEELSSRDIYESLRKLPSADFVTNKHLGVDKDAHGFSSPVKPRNKGHLSTWYQ